MMQWHLLMLHPNELNWTDQHLAAVELDGRKIVVAKYQDAYFGFPQKCPHAGADMVNGYVDMQGNVVCPLHRYKFCLKNGRNVSGEGYFMKTYPIEEREDGWYIGLPPKSLFGII